MNFSEAEKKFLSKVDPQGKFGLAEKTKEIHERAEERRLKPLLKRQHQIAKQLSQDAGSELGYKSFLYARARTILLLFLGVAAISVSSYFILYFTNDEKKSDIKKYMAIAVASISGLFLLISLIATKRRPKGKRLNFASFMTYLSLIVLLVFSVPEAATEEFVWYDKVGRVK